MKQPELQTGAASTTKRDYLRVRRRQGAAAFFDVDGTLCAGTSLERRLFVKLCREGRMPLRNALAWLVEAMRLLPSGIERACFCNKTYLRGVAIGSARAAMDGMQENLFFQDAIERVGWHVERGHRIVLVTGSLEDLAVCVANRLKQELSSAGGPDFHEILICATRLEEREGNWTGRALGKVMRGRKKAVAMKRLAEQHGWKLADCWAYGDSTHDQWMLGIVGHAVAVNPGRKLARLARESGWLEMRWSSLSSSHSFNERRMLNGTHSAEAAGQRL